MYFDGRGYFYLFNVFNIFALNHNETVYKTVVDIQSSEFKGKIQD